MNSKRGELSCHWKGDAVSIAAARQRAHRLFPGPLFCDVCGDPAERHHRDGDPRNNAPDNIARLCPKHHRDVDGRTKRLHETAAVANRGRKRPPRSKEWCTALSVAMTGKSHTQETREKLRQANHYRGENHPNARLNAADVIAIRASTATRRALAKQYGVVAGTIKAIRLRRIWKHTDG